MSFLSFFFYVVIAYILYYAVVLSYDLLTGKSDKNPLRDTLTQYDIGQVPAPKVAVLKDDDNSTGGLKNELSITEDQSTQEMYDENEKLESVDLTLENINRQVSKNGIYKY